jgi:hypothetical protein
LHFTVPSLTKGAAHAADSATLITGEGNLLVRKRGGRRKEGGLRHFAAHLPRLPPAFLSVTRTHYSASCHIPSAIAAYCLHYAWQNFKQTSYTGIFRVWLLANTARCAHAAAARVTLACRAPAFCCLHGDLDVLLWDGCLLVSRYTCLTFMLYRDVPSLSRGDNPVPGCVAVCFRRCGVHDG